MQDRQIIKNLSEGYAGNKENLCLSFGIVSGCAVEKFVFGNNCRELSNDSRIYEIGSLTKTFTAGLIERALEGHLMKLSDEVVKNITVLKLLTHTSNIGEFPGTKDAIENMNPFTGYTKADILKYVNQIAVSPNGTWEYSNLGYALLGIHLEKVYQTPYPIILKNYIDHHICIKNTDLCFHSNAVTGYNYNKRPANWMWKKDDAFLPAGALQSTLDDMIVYLIQQMNPQKDHLCHTVHAETEMPFHMGLAWMIEKETGIIFNMGLTEGFSAFIGYHRKANKGIVILSNYSGAGYRNPDTPNGIGLQFLQWTSAAAPH